MGVDMFVTTILMIRIVSEFIDAQRIAATSLERIERKTAEFLSGFKIF